MRLNWCTTCLERTAHKESPRGMVCEECGTVHGPHYYDIREQQRKKRAEDGVLNYVPIEDQEEETDGE